MIRYPSLELVLIPFFLFLGALSIRLRVVDDDPDTGVPGPSPKQKSLYLASCSREGFSAADYVDIDDPRDGTLSIHLRGGKHRLRKKTYWIFLHMEKTFGPNFKPAPVSFPFHFEASSEPSFRFLGAWWRIWVARKKIMVGRGIVGDEHPESVDHAWNRPTDLP